MGHCKISGFESSAMLRLAPFEASCMKPAAALVVTVAIAALVATLADAALAAEGTAFKADPANPRNVIAV